MFQVKRVLLYGASNKITRLQHVVTLIPSSQPPSQPIPRSQPPSQPIPRSQSSSQPIPRSQPPSVSTSSQPPSQPIPRSQPPSCTQITATLLCADHSHPLCAGHSHPLANAAHSHPPVCRSQPPSQPMQVTATPNSQYPGHSHLWPIPRSAAVSTANAGHSHPHSHPHSQYPGSNGSPDSATLTANTQLTATLTANADHSRPHSQCQITATLWPIPGSVTLCVQLTATLSQPIPRSQPPSCRSQSSSRSQYPAHSHPHSPIPRSQPPSQPIPRSQPPSQPIPRSQPPSCADHNTLSQSPRSQSSSVMSRSQPPSQPILG
ncbi:integrator complex subunit 3 homolog [Homarus americanus]|uniref:integrator complex subunit 3 homolog n=1 Tax=Homarus americanus TaxID=6706 RepID=UPI001C481716|nr:integrator complex subunit 3 homolog [Homarus americanus]